MDYRLGNNKKIKSNGDTLPLVCPKCKKEVTFGVFSNLDRRIAVKKIPFEISTVYFLVCPECASVFTVDEAKGKSFKKDIAAITSDDLKELEAFHPEI